MPFRFQISEVAKARKPIVVMIGDVQEGQIRVGDFLSMSLRSGNTFRAKVVDILHAWPDTQSYESVSAEERLSRIAIAIECHDVQGIEDILLTEVTGSEDLESNPHATEH